MPAFLFEIGLEEIPAGMVDAAQKELEKRFRELVTRERLVAEGFSVQSFSTPRRLAILADGLLPKQADIEEQIVGPSVAVAYKNGAPTGAVIAFAKKAGVELGALETIQNAKGEYVSATVRRQGRSAGEVLTSLLPAEMAGIYWGKNMYWRAGKPERFVRPVRWLLALLDEEVLPVKFAGVSADGVSYGHRVLYGGSPVVIPRPQEYAEKLRTAYVEIDPAVRRHRIRKALDAATREIPGAQWRPDEELIEAVTHLTEWPSVILGSFEASYLNLPEEVLVTVMRGHQKYFALEDTAGKLLPNFLAVLNIEVDAAGADIIRHGNERVLRARFNDAKFFWDVDQKIPLVDRVELLKSVTFHKDLGSYWDKTERNRKVANNLITNMYPPLFKLDTFSHRVDQATLLAKTDLTTEMVKEFTELQGVVGGLYARAQRLPDGVARAIADHYKPMSQEDSIPRTPAGSIVALADKIGTIVDMFAKGFQPTGSKDPFALRRAGNGVIRILVEDRLLGDKLHLERVCAAGANDTLAMQNASLQASIYDFLLDRFEFYLRDSRGIHPQVARAIRNAGTTVKDYEFYPNQIGYGNIADFAEELNRQRSNEDIQTIAELLKRTSNILRQADERGLLSLGVSQGILQHPVEMELHRRASGMPLAILQKYQGRNYSAIISDIAGLREPLSQFFESVMVMVEDTELRQARLWLLSYTKKIVGWAADFSELASI